MIALYPEAGNVCNGSPPPPPAQPLTLYDWVSNGLDSEMSLLKDTQPVTKVIVLLMEAAPSLTRR